MTREEFYKLTDVLNSEVLGSFMHGGEADELIAMFEEAVDHSNILEQEEPTSEDLEEAAKLCVSDSLCITNKDDWDDAAIEALNMYKAGAKWQKEQMMAKAIDAHCFGFQGGALFSFRLLANNYLVGSEVKVIVIKED